MTASPLANQTHDTIQPGLMVVHGNRLEGLRDLLVEWLARAPLAPLEDEVMLVQSNGIAQWLQRALARPRDEGGMGISAAVDLQLPGRFLWQAYRTVLGREVIAADSPFDKARLAWRLMRLLPAQLDDPAFAPLRHFLGDSHDLVKRFQLASDIADLFDQYQVYRADWLDDWGRGHDTLRDARHVTTALPASQRWQALLWRAVLADVGAPRRARHRAAVHQAFMQAVATLHERPSGLPRRVVVFGISSLPQQTLEALTALGRVAQVFLLVSNPCRHYWGDIIEDRELLRAPAHRHANKPGMPAAPRFEDLHTQANPLLAAWGKQGRDYLRLLDSFDQPDAYRTRFAALGRDIDLFDDPGSDTLLHQVQHAILELEPLPPPGAAKPLLMAGDDSLRFHIAHNAQREVEVLHDNLLALFEAAAAADKPLSPRDVMVMVPDIGTYAPHIQAVFGRIATDDPRYLPSTIADRPARGSTPLLTALDYLLHTPTARFAASEILDLLDTPALCRRFGLTDDDPPRLRAWIAGAGIRWGLSGAQKAGLNVPTLEQNTWRFGLQRMLLGYAVGDGELLDGIAPYAEIGGLDAALVGPLTQLVDRLDHHREQLATPATPTQWARRARALLDDFFDAGRDDHDAVLLQRLRDGLADWEKVCADAGFDTTVPIGVMREHWLAGLDAQRLSQRFLGGAVNFGTLMPMRAIPFRVVCLLGMNDGDYPRRHDAPDFDLMAERGQPRPGDRSRREDDRYLFLEALLAAREHLYVSWVGRSERDNAELPPSVLVGQLRDYLAAGWQAGAAPPCASAEPALAPHDSDGGLDTLSALTTEYPLQAFSTDYFTTHGNPRIFTYAHEWRRARRGGGLAATDPRLSPWQPESPLGIAFLQRFLKAPAQTFYRMRLGVHFGNPVDSTEDDEPFVLDHLGAHVLGAALLRAGLLDGTQAIAGEAGKLTAQGEVPASGFGRRALVDARAVATGVSGTWGRLTTRWPNVLPPCAIHHVAHGLTIEDSLNDLREGDAGGQRVRVVTTASRLLKDGKLQHAKCTDAWVIHLLANTQAETGTVMVGADQVVQLKPLARDAAGEKLDDVLAAIVEGMCAPLPITRDTAFAWLAGKVEGAGSRARACYDGSDHTGYGEVRNHVCLAREWPDFDALHAAGFERWLPLYAGLIEAASTEAAA